MSDGEYDYPKESQLTKIGESAFIFCGELKSISIPSLVDSIGIGAFNGCSKLEKVSFNEDSQLTLINIITFFRCSELKSVSIPSSVNSIGDSAHRRRGAQKEFDAAYHQKVFT